MTRKNVGEPRDGTTETTTYCDGKFIRTAIVAKADRIGSLDVVAIGEDGQVRRLARINVCYYLDSEDRGKDRVIVDVIDVERRYQTKRALAFSQTERRQIEMPEGGMVLSCDFSGTRS